MLRQHVRDAAPAAPARPRRRPRLAERHEVPRRATPTCSPASSRRATPRCASASCGRAARSAACSRPMPPGCCCAACARCTCGCRARSRRAAELARRLAAHPAVAAVHYPGLARAPDHELALRQMPDGAGGVLAFELADGAERQALRGRRAARALRDQPRRRRDADRVPRAHGARGSRARGPAAALRRPRGRRRPLGRPGAGDRARRAPQRERARGMLRAMEPDSLLVRGLVDNPSRRPLPRARSLDDVRARAGRRLALRSRARAGRGGGRGAAGRARGCRGDALRERHDGLDVPLPRRCSGRARRS